MSLPLIAVLAACAGAALCAFMAAAALVQQRTGNSGWIDVSWTAATGVVAIALSLAPFGSNSALHWRQAVVSVLVALWCLRLSLHIASRSRLNADDPRYRWLIAAWGGEAKRRMFWFLQSQAAVSVVLVVSIMLAARNPDPDVRVQDLLGIAILAAGIIGEAVADRQLRRFSRSHAGERSAVCDVGLWRWSRHPNYFFEWLGWVAYPLIAIDLSGQNPFGWLALAAPACMYWVLVHVSGVPPLEDHMLRTRGDAFRAYQRKTRPFFPLPII
jgi:steroid 5-alpha reductase family enzyme